MANRDTKHDLSCAGRLPVIACLICGIVWSADAFVDALYYGQGTIFERLFTPGTLELWLRTMAASVVIAFSFYARSLTSRYLRTNEELQRANLRAEAANRVKHIFLANVSHEIRTPLTAILGYTDELLVDGDLRKIPVRRLVAIDAIRRNGKHLFEIVNNLLDLSKIGAGELKLERLKSSPLRIAAEVCSLLRIGATQMGLRLSAEFPGPLPETINTDPARVRQILINLIGNSLKFSEQGAVRLVTRLVEDGIGPKIQFEVIDSGIGMSPETIDRLFEPFHQADNSASRKHGGTGLGLTICRRLVDALEGELEVESEPGLGTTVRVTLPIGSLEGVRMIEISREAVTAPDPSQDARPDKPSTESLTGRILLADDCLDNQRLFRQILERAGAQVEVAGNGRIALERALEARDHGESFDVILMDMQMPILDGYSATRALRQAGYTRPIVAFTAHVTSADREECLKVGCDDFAPKPIDKATLCEMLSRNIADGERKNPVRV